MKLLLFLALTFGFVGCKTLDAVKTAADKYGVTEDVEAVLKVKVVDVLLTQIEANGVDVEGRELKDLLVGQHKVYLYYGSEPELHCYQYHLEEEGRVDLHIRELDHWECLDGGIGIDLKEVIKGVGGIPKSLANKDSLFDYGKALVYKVLTFYLVGGVGVI